MCELPDTKRARLISAPDFTYPSGYLKGSKTVDPLHFIRALAFSKYLRNQAEFSEALQAAQEFDCPELDDAKRDSSRDPGYGSLLRVAERVDVVDLLLHRREFAADYEHDTLIAVNVFSDSSPSSGEEFQGIFSG